MAASRSTFFYFHSSPPFGQSFCPQSGRIWRCDPRTHSSFICPAPPGAPLIHDLNSVQHSTYINLKHSLYLLYIFPTLFTYIRILECRMSVFNVRFDPVVIHDLKSAELQNVSSNYFPDLFLSSKISSNYFLYLIISTVKDLKDLLLFPYLYPQSASNICSVLPPWLFMTQILLTPTSLLTLLPPADVSPI